MLISGEKLAGYGDSTNKVAEKMAAIAEKIESGEITVSKEQISSYFLVAKESKDKTSIFIDKQGSAWGSIGISLGIIAFFQVIIILNIYSKSKIKSDG